MPSAGLGVSSIAAHQNFKDTGDAPYGMLTNWSNSSDAPVCPPRYALKAPVCGYSVTPTLPKPSQGGSDPLSKPLFSMSCTQPGSGVAVPVGVLVGVLVLVGVFVSVGVGVSGRVSQNRFPESVFPVSGA